MQLFAQAMGFRTISGQVESDLMGYLISQRDNIRAYRREYLEAMAKNDFSEAEDIQKEFQERFPSLGKLEVKKSDLETIKTRKMITRLEKVLDTLPASMRAQYGEIVAAALGQEAGRMMGVDPSYLSDPTTTTRRSRPRMYPQMFSGMNTQNLQPPTSQTQGATIGGSAGGFGSFGLPF
jgi:hypothetical protein